MVTTACVIQARAGSSRLPGKVLADLGGRPMLGFMLERISGLDVDHLVVATSAAPADDAVADVARSAGADVVRGPEDDVLARFGRVLDELAVDRIVRLTGDCPLTDPAVVGEALDLALAAGADYVSNTLVRTYPDGLDVEVVAADALAEADAKAGDPVEREHVTPYVYRQPRAFSLGNLRTGRRLGHLRWTVDTAADLDRVRALVERVGRLDAPWEEFLEPGLPAAPDFRPADEGDRDAVLALRNDPEAVRWSRSGRAVDPGDHAAWFDRVLTEPSARLWVLDGERAPVASARIDVDDGVGTVSIAVDPASRGRGVAKRALTGLVSALSADHQVHTLAADVHRDHEASLRLFEGSGFGRSGSEGDWVRLERARSPDGW